MDVNAGPGRMIPLPPLFGHNWVVLAVVWWLLISRLAVRVEVTFCLRIIALLKGLYKHPLGISDAIIS